MADKHPNLTSKGGKEWWVLKAKKSMIADVLGITLATLNYWIRQKRIDIRDLRSVCECYAEINKWRILAKGISGK